MCVDGNPNAMLSVRGLKGGGVTMVVDRPAMVRAAAASAGFLVLASAGLAMAAPDGPARMSELRLLHEIAGYDVFDNNNVRIGEVTRIDTDGRSGHARYVHVSLDAGGNVKVAAFRAFFNARKREVEVRLPQDILFERASVETGAAPTEPSVGT
jgi:hypothetical protein